MSQSPSLSGRLLVAMPGIGDPRFEHAVILICAHGPDHAMGLRLDRPVSGVDLKAVLDRLDLAVPETAPERQILAGGPVERERGFVLHTDDWVSPESSLAFGDGLAMTGTRDALVAMADVEAGPDRALLVLGYAGWGEGQLEDELAENVWLMSDADLDLIFDADHDTKWARALARIGVDAGRLSAQGGRA
ncbi:MAG: YqgE/AlgH family protein [Brevundimonas sp.]|uniref:YqgE/AlgH family protein n=1 Tax=Brevundimonas sp. TaxID=1871086 RepID=UPI0025BB781A|nr:YqgE/AlgH family protein [Brevundimonas sp.]MBX3478091.1 YqgE/AlgH family protein [Brevundimonas sp.]